MKVFERVVKKNEKTGKEYEKESWKSLIEFIIITSFNLKPKHLSGNLKGS